MSYPSSFAFLLAFAFLSAFALSSAHPQLGIHVSM
uniref:Uncharacterized protein n=1 Tax=Siphoviridae sp. ctr2f5 TaxID=2825684 RepID=A0A8S5QFR9_9CAUD|nr:MAG TPA: hypothetical protein [Siphoviridae sp. ctr2f5]